MGCRLILGQSVTATETHRGGVVIRPGPELGKGLMHLPNRIVRDGILRSKKIASVGPMAQLFYRCLMSVVDDFGRYYDDPALLLSDCFPFRPAWADEPSMSLWIEECSQAGLLLRYSVSGTRYLEIANFSQRIRPGVVSKFPQFAADGGETRRDAARATPPTTPSSASSGDRGVGEGGIPIIRHGTELFERLIGTFLAAGVKLSEPQMLAAGTEWVSLDDSEWLPATEFSESRARSTEARWMGLPASYLRNKSWKAKGPGRTLPLPREPSKRESGLAQAIQTLKRERGEI